MSEPMDLDAIEREPVDPLAWTPPRFLRRHAARTAHRRRRRRLVTGAIVALLGFGFLFADGGLASILWRRFRIHRLEKQVAVLAARQKWLQEEAGRRKKDRATIERIAREEYGMIYPGEKLIRIVAVSEKEARRVEKAQATLQAEVEKAPPPRQAAKGAGGNKLVQRGTRR